MISDEPDEDADFLDDDAAMESYFGEIPPGTAPATAAMMQLPDWPPSRGEDNSLHVEIETLAWFKATSADWRREMRSVLRAWIAAKAVERQAVKLQEPARECRRPEDQS